MSYSHSINRALCQRTLCSFRTHTRSQVTFASLHLHTIERVCFVWWDEWRWMCVVWNELEFKWMWSSNMLNTTRCHTISNIPMNIFCYLTSSCLVELIKMDGKQREFTQDFHFPEENANTIVGRFVLKFVSNVPRNDGYTPKFVSYEEWQKIKGKKRGKIVIVPATHINIKWRGDKYIVSPENK